MPRKFIIICGEQRSGKSYLANNMLANYIHSGNTGLVYNLGRTTDFECATAAKLFTEREHIKLMDKERGKEYADDPKQLYFSLIKTPQKIELFPQININYAGKALKFWRIDRRSERVFIYDAFEYLSNTMLILDDARPIFRYGIADEYLQILFRRDHAGYKNPAKNWQGAGIDIVLIFHTIEQVNNELFDSNPLVINFKYRMKPNTDGIENAYLKHILPKIHDVLYRMPKYSYSITDTETEQTTIYNAEERQFYDLIY